MNVKGSLYIQHGLYYVILSYKDCNNKRKQKWIPTGISEKGNNKRLAKDKLEEIKQNYTQYIPQEVNLENSDEGEKFFEVYLQEWLESYKTQIEENTYDSYKTVVKKVFEFFNGQNIMLKNLKPVHIQKFYDHLFQKGLCSNTVLHYHANIRKALAVAVKLEIINTNPADKIERPKKNQFIGDYYTIDELNTLFKKSKSDPLHLIVLVASFYGLRRSEVLGLRWSAFDFENNTIEIKHKVIETIVDNERTILLKDKTKNKSSHRTLPLIPEIKETLLKRKQQILKNKEICGNCYNNNYLDYIFVDDIGKITRPEYVTDHFSLLLKKCGLRHIRFHDLRHSCASLLLAKGVPMKAIQEWLGHSTYSTTANLYAHLDSNAKNISANVLSNVINFS